ncbi:IS91 family transposase [Thiolapillus brandeum]|uniref:IS91 family transposase n=1 Tax=Thiolapillus brandeum TaxID=1076588 RepID=UPI000697D006|nr:transposase [Thiolapillus brandeum]
MAEPLTLQTVLQQHCLIPGGVLTEKHQWQAARSTYLFPVRALSRHFRGKMVSRLRQCASAGQLNHITRTDEIDDILNQFMKKDWVVYSKPCINHTETVVRYLARYSHKIAISDARIVGIENDQVRFRYRDDQSRVITLRTDELIRRFLLHVLPNGFMRIRHYGLLANRCRNASLEKIRRILAQPAKAEEEKSQTGRSRRLSLSPLPPGASDPHLRTAPGMADTRQGAGMT